VPIWVAPVLSVDGVRVARTGALADDSVVVATRQGVAVSAEGGSPSTVAAVDRDDRRRFVDLAGLDVSGIRLVAGAAALGTSLDSPLVALSWKARVRAATRCGGGCI
jgi:hypothetical protein